MRRSLAATLLVAATAMPAQAQTYADIDVDLPAFPDMQPIPDSPVWWAPGVDSNYFFYDGLFWDFEHDAWHWSHWYNGPWTVADPVYVPTYVLWVPIVYYRKPPHYFRGWNANRPPRWGEHWGREWQARHNQIYTGPAGSVMRAPLPLYQSHYTRSNYPRGAQLYALHSQHYVYQPREPVIRQHYENRGITPQHPSSQDTRREDPRSRDRR